MGLNRGFHASQLVERCISSGKIMGSTNTSAAFPIQISAKLLRYFVNMVKNDCEMTPFVLTKTHRLVIVHYKTPSHLRYRYTAPSLNNDNVTFYVKSNPLK